MLNCIQNTRTFKDQDYLTVMSRLVIGYLQFIYNKLRHFFLL